MILSGVSGESWPFAGITLIAMVLYLINFNFFQVGNWNDDAVYIILARAITSGQGYARINFPTPQPEVAWPFGYPLLLSPLVAIWPFNFTPLKIMSLVLTVTSIFILKKVLDFRIRHPFALLILALFKLNPYHSILTTYLGLFAPYLERDFFLSATPEVSNVPRTI